ncbi:MAG: type II secretion system F family protein [Gammaproteobacteria bacterium]|nr:MAG: type II secretion system F family protein [Gammaproteobacteria bacterium]
MPRFRYKGRSDRGEAIEGYIEGVTAEAIATQLFNSGITPINISEAPAQLEALANLKRMFKLGRPSLEDLIMFSRQMYALQKAGVPIIRGLTGIAQSTRNILLQEALRDIVDSLDAGRDMASSLARHPKIFNPLFISVIQVGENSGRLDESFLQMFHYLEREKDTRDRVKAAVRYPIIVVLFIFAAIVVMNMLVIPVFTKMFKKIGADLPIYTQILIKFSDFTVAYWYYILFGMVVSIVVLVNYVRSPKGRYQWHKLQLRIPIIGPLLLRASLARFARSMAMSLRSGVPIIQGLSAVSRAINNDFLGERILMMRNGIERGESLTRTAMTTGQFTPLTIQMLAVGEEAGNLDGMLQDVADFYEREVDYDIKYLSDAIQPIMVTFVGALVLILALGIFLPMVEFSASFAARRGG